MLENKKISIKDYYEIQNKRFNWGKEGTVTEINNNVIKLFYPDFGNKVISQKEIELIAQNKFNKLKYLASTPEFTNYLKPLFTCTINDKFVGYGYKKINCNTFDEEILDRESLIFYLKKLKDTLIKYHDIGIIHGDITPFNFFVDKQTKEVIIGDIDNMKVNNYNIDFLPWYAHDFIKKYGCIDSKLDAYLFNLMTIERFSDGNWYDTIISQLEKNNIPNILEKTDKHLLKQMVKVDKNYKEKYLIDSIS